MKQGDEVTWNTPQGKTTGTLVEKKTQEFQHDKQKFNASEDEPYWIVESVQTGSKAAHKESTLEQK